jgi:hypothetical protein
MLLTPDAALETGFYGGRARTRGGSEYFGHGANLLRQRARPRMVCICCCLGQAPGGWIKSQIGLQPNRYGRKQLLIL